MKRDTEKRVVIGDVVEPWGKVGAMLITCGEPYYMLHKNGVVSLMPAKVVSHHAAHAKQSRAKRK